jgi:hypothetical protein
MIALLIHSAVVCLGIQTEYVDCIELNHQHDDKGCYVFSQVIAWEFVPETKQKHVRAWELVKHQLPRTSDGITRYQSESMRIHSRIFRESWTQIDPERADLLRGRDRYSLAVRATK